MATAMSVRTAGIASYNAPARRRKRVDVETGDAAGTAADQSGPTLASPSTVSAQLPSLNHRPSPRTRRLSRRKYLRNIRKLQNSPWRTEMALFVVLFMFCSLFYYFEDRHHNTARRRGADAIMDTVQHNSYSIDMSRPIYRYRSGPKVSLELRFSLRQKRALGEMQHPAYFIGVRGGPDQGNLVITPLDGTNWLRIIDDKDFEHFRGQFLHGIDRHMSSTLVRPDERAVELPPTCRVVNWAWNMYPACNVLHEAIALEHSSQQDIRFLGHGAFRDGWLVRTKSMPDFVLKKLRHTDGLQYDAHMQRNIHVEALILERLSAAPTIVDIYAHCGTSVLVEAMPVDITEQIIPGNPHEYDRGRIAQTNLDALQTHDVHPMNNFTAAQKLDIAISMAEALAESHGYAGGVIMNNDVHPDQWVMNVRGQIKLNDFNNGYFRTFDVAKNDYCTYSTCFVNSFKSPEELNCGVVDEQADTYAMGNNIYALLTGLLPHYEFLEHSKGRALTKAGVLPYIDPRYRTRSYIEGRLVEILERAWIFDRTERATIFQVVAYLRETKQLYESRH